LPVEAASIRWCFGRWEAVPAARFLNFKKDNLQLKKVITPKKLGCLFEAA
jgi:hypothetical protein